MTHTLASADEPTQRAAIFRRFKELLIKQCEYFHSYLSLLEKQQAAIESGSVEELLAYIELEEQIVANILSIQKVIHPLEDLYNAAVSFSADDEIPALKITVEELKNQAITRSARNKNLLSTRMADIRAEITSLKNNPLANISRSLYHNSGTAALIDIKG